MKKKQTDLITVREARELLGVGAPKMARLLRDGVLEHWTKPLDTRIKLVSKQAVLDLMERVDKAA